jgi:signal transduction histidine kinase
MPSAITPFKIIQRAFPGIVDALAQEMVGSGIKVTVPARTVICREGAVETTFYIILSGEVQVTKLINESEIRLLTHLRPGDFFGEMAIIHNAPRAATVTSTQETTLLEINNDTFTNLIERSSSMSMAMVRAVSNRLRDNDEMAIEDLRQKASELAVAYQQLADLESARSQFLTTIAHELRTPLMAAAGFIQVIRTGKLQGSSLNSALDTVSSNIQEIINLTNDILFLQEMDLILDEFQLTDIGSLLTSCVENMRSRATNNQVGILVNIPANLPEIPADPKSLQRSFSAILENAIKFSPEGGEIEIKAEFDEHTLKVTITDAGVGIPPEALPHIFDRFFHIDQIDKHLFRGIGLGLSIARQVIEQHHGTIEAQSQLSAGSTFTITLPR